MKQQNRHLWRECTKTEKQMSDQKINELKHLECEVGKTHMWVEEFAENPDDSTYLCVLRLLADYRRLQAQEVEEAIYKLETENKCN